MFHYESVIMPAFLGNAQIVMNGGTSVDYKLQYLENL